MQIKTLMRYHLTEWPSLECLQIINAGQGVEKNEPSYPDGGNVNWCSHYGENMEIPQKRIKKLVIIWSCNLTPGAYI